MFREALPPRDAGRTSTEPSRDQTWGTPPSTKVRAEVPSVGAVLFAASREPGYWACAGAAASPGPRWFRVTEVGSAGADAAVVHARNAVGTGGAGGSIDDGVGGAQAARARCFAATAAPRAAAPGAAVAAGGAGRGAHGAARPRCPVRADDAPDTGNDDRVVAAEAVDGAVDRAAGDGDDVVARLRAPAGIAWAVPSATRANPATVPKPITARPERPVVRACRSMS